MRTFNTCLLSLVLNTFETDNRVIRSSTWSSYRYDRVIVFAMGAPHLQAVHRRGRIIVVRISIRFRGMPRPLKLVTYLEWLIRAAYIANRYRPSAVIANDLNTLPIIPIFRLMYFFIKPRIIYDAHEFNPDHTRGKSKVTVFLRVILEWVLIRFVDKCITVSDSIAKRYSEIHGKDFECVYNIPDALTQSSGVERNALRKGLRIPEESVVFMTHGWIRGGRGIELALEAFSATPSAHLVIMGRGEELVQHVINVSKLHANIHYIPAVKPENVVSYCKLADYGLVLIPPVSFSYEHCLPNKFHEYIQARVPVIVSDTHELSRAVRLHNNGYVLARMEVDDLKCLVGEILRLKPRFRKGCEQAIEAYSPETNRARFDSILS
jgi:glycosyltransferase involved in cell wall biosynthesis